MAITKREDVQSKVSVKINTLKKTPSSGKSLSTYSISVSISISLSLKSVSEFAGAASSMSDIVTSANGKIKIVSPISTFVLNMLTLE